LGFIIGAKAVANNHLNHPCYWAPKKEMCVIVSSYPFFLLIMLSLVKIADLSINYVKILIFRVLLLSKYLYISFQLPQSTGDYHTQILLEPVTFGLLALNDIFLIVKN
jgi:hypothetical protein